MKGGDFMSTDEIEKLGKSKRNEYYRNYRKNNREKIKKTQDKYWQTRALKESNTNNKEV